MTNLSPEMTEDLAHERTEWLQAFGLNNGDVMDDEEGEYIRPYESSLKVRLPRHLQMQNIYH